MDTPDTSLRPPESFQVSSHSSGQLLQAPKEDFTQHFVRMKLWDSLSLVSSIGCLLEPQEFVCKLLAMFSTPRNVLRVPQPSTEFPRIDHTSYSESSSPALLSLFVQVPQSLRVVLRPREVQSVSGLPLELYQASGTLRKVLGKSSHRPECESGTVLHLHIVAFVAGFKGPCSLPAPLVASVLPLHLVIASSHVCGQISRMGFLDCHCMYCYIYVFASSCVGIRNCRA